MAFEWSEAKERAAMLIAVGDKKNRAIAKEIGIAESTLYLWVREEEFAKQVEVYRTEIRQRVMEEGIASASDRMARSNLRWAQLLQITEERGKAKRHQHVPGWKTGLLCHTQRVIGRGEDSTTVDVYELDAALIREERELQKQAAQETGQWIERSETSAQFVVVDI